MKKNRVKVAGTLALLVLLSPNHVPAQEHSDDVDRYWNLVLSNWRAEQSAIESIEYRFTHEIRRDERPVSRKGRPRPQSIAKTVSFKRDGDAFLERSEGILDNDTQKKLRAVVAYDGRVGRSRLSLSPNMLLIGKSEKARERTVPLPWEALIGLSPELLEEQRQRGQLALHSATTEELEGRKCIKIELVWHPSKRRFIAWYDTERGYWPIRTLDLTESGQKAHEFLIQEIKEVEGEHGNTFFVPIRGIRESVGERMTVHVDPESIRINHDIAPDEFLLVPRPDEIIFDIDLPCVIG